MAFPTSDFENADPLFGQPEASIDNIIARYSPPLDATDRLAYNYATGVTPSTVEMTELVQAGYVFNNPHAYFTEQGLDRLAEMGVDLVTINTLILGIKVTPSVRFRNPDAPNEWLTVNVPLMVGSELIVRFAKFDRRGRVQYYECYAADNIPTLLIAPNSRHTFRTYRWPAQWPPPTQSVPFPPPKKKKRSQA